MPTPTTPISTYRLQFNAAFTFDAATDLVGYLDLLGISHAYASSYLRASPGSTHGYDLVDPLSLNPEIGSEQSYRRWIAALRAHGMGHILDIVPNHMGIAHSANPWWQDVLENGPSSRYAPVFDIDWQPLKPELRARVLLPILGDSFGAVLERGEIRLRYNQGAFFVEYGDNTLPVAPGTYGLILDDRVDQLLERLCPDSMAAAEYLSILTSINRLPPRDSPDPEAHAERAREKEIIKRRLSALVEESPIVAQHVDRAVARFNGVPGDPRSFDRLDELLAAQAFRLAYWRVAAEEINYRRFFDINELAAIRVEDPEVFDLVHAFVFDLIRQGLIDGLRVDHVDGLYDPEDYLRRLQSRVGPIFVVVEKILGMDERLRDWPVEGTTGYDFQAMVNGLFVDRRSDKPLKDIYERFTRERASFREVAYRSKELVLRLSMSSELNVLAHQLTQFAERNRHYRDFTLNSLVQAMRAIIACFPVYRSYVNDRGEPDESDRRYIDAAVTEAKRRNPGHPRAVFDFVRNLLLKQADAIPADQRDEHLRFVAKFQQVTSPVTAKGIEDTALYTYNRLVSLNDVGNEPDRFGLPPERVHAWMRERAARWPRALSALSTHDSKRSEDVRARLNVLSEIPGAWKQAIARWARMNRRARTTIDGRSYPTRNEEYLLYQTLLGSWPLMAPTVEEERDYVERIVEYMRKAMREAKVVTSWLNPSEPHEKAMSRFVRIILASGGDGQSVGPSAGQSAAFRQDFLEFHARVSRLGLYNSLAQLALKIGAPGIPDFYQGTEIWNFSLVDPDNRRPVDYEWRQRLMDDISRHVAADDARQAFIDELVASPADDRLKLYATTTMLRYRAASRELFEEGGYDSIAIDGARREHVFAFSRAAAGRQVVVAVPRLVAGLQPDATPPIGERVWGDTRLELPPRSDDRRPCCFRHVLTGERISTDDSRRFLRAADVFARFPIAMLDAEGA
jgi:(1->4)-alpha-D-glucan 1-alpha-D-glucosylmutase